MRTLIIYDDYGFIFHQASGDVMQPVGLQHMFIELKSGQRVERIDVSDKESHVPILAKQVISETDKLWDSVTYLLGVK